MRARITAEMVVGRGLLLRTDEVVDVAVFGDYVDCLVRDSAIELVEPILAVVDPPQPNPPASLI
jgi:hypothetical protein